MSEDLSQVPVAEEAVGETPEFENGVAWDADNNLLIEPDAPAEAIAEAEPVIEAPAPVTPEVKSSPELDLIKTQIESLKKELQYKDQILGLAKTELEKHLQKQQGDIPEDFDFLETFADKQKGMGFLQNFVAKAVQQQTQQVLGVIPQVVGSMLMQQQVQNFRQANPEAFGSDGWILPEIYQKLEPILNKYKNMTLDDAYRPYKELYKQKSLANKQIQAQKAQRLQNTRNIGSAATNTDPVQPKGKLTVEQAFKLAEQQHFKK